MAKAAQADPKGGQARNGSAPADAPDDGGSPDDIMSKNEMKPILARARRGAPVYCAICLSSDKDGVILLDRKRPAKKLFAELKKQARDIGLEIDRPSLRFGLATVDPEIDPALVTFAVNKEPPAALRPKLLARLRRMGFTKVEIILGGD